MSRLEIFFLPFENVKVIDGFIPYSQYIPVNLSISNLDLSPINMQSPQRF